MKVTVVVAWPRRQCLVRLELPEGATVRDAVAASGLAARFPDLDIASMATGIWNRRCGPQEVLREADRVELYREITADAKALRRARAGATPSRRARSGR